jgi:hypothetical protein
VFFGGFVWLIVFWMTYDKLACLYFQHTVLFSIVRVYETVRSGVKRLIFRLFSKISPHLFSHFKESIWPNTMPFAPCVGADCNGPTV